jgi:ABC-type glycerol-3-phosphate transport system permease component
LSASVEERTTSKDACRYEKAMRQRHAPDVAPPYPTHLSHKPLHRHLPTLPGADKFHKPSCRSSGASVNSLTVAIPATLIPILLAAFAAHLAWQIASLQIGNSALCLRLFRANREVGLAVATAILIGWV